MKLSRCSNGHYYDGEMYENCPHCGNLPPVDDSLPTTIRQAGLDVDHNAGRSAVFGQVGRRNNVIEPAESYPYEERVDARVSADGYPEEEYAGSEDPGDDYPEEEYAESEDFGDDYPEEEYAESDDLDDDYPEEEYAESDDLDDDYPEEEYAETDDLDDDYPEEEYAETDDLDDDYPEEEYAETDDLDDDYPEEEYAETDDLDDDYPEEEYAEPEHSGRTHTGKAKRVSVVVTTRKPSVYPTVEATLDNVSGKHSVVESDEFLNRSRTPSRLVVGWLVRRISDTESADYTLTEGKNYILNNGTADSNDFRDSSNAYACVEYSPARNDFLLTVKPSCTVWVNDVECTDSIRLCSRDIIRTESDVFVFVALCERGFSWQ